MEETILKSRSALEFEEHILEQMRLTLENAQENYDKQLKLVKEMRGEN